MNIGENLKRLRVQKGMTQLELAERVGVSGPMITQVERGTKALNILLAKAIVDVLGCTLDGLLAEPKDA